MQMCLVCIIFFFETVPLIELAAFLSMSGVATLLVMVLELELDVQCMAGGGVVLSANPSQAFGLCVGRPPPIIAL